MNLEALYRLHARDAARVAGRVLRDDERAEDLVQSVFAQLLARPGAEVDAVQAPWAWLRRVTLNAALNERRRVRLDGETPESESEWPASDPEIDGVVAARELVDRLWGSLDELDRDLLRICCFEGDDQETAAARLGIWRRTVGRHLERLRARGRGLARTGHT